MDDLPPLRSGSYVTAAELAGLARQSLGDVTHAEAAAELGMKRPALSRGLNVDDPSVPICTKVLRRYGGYGAEPVYRLVRLGAEAG